MNSSLKAAALSRLKAAPMRSRVTEEAERLLKACCCEAALVVVLSDTKKGPAALEVLCALRPSSEPVYEAVLRAIDADAALSCALIESLNRLPWYDGMRAFLNLPHPPTTFTAAYEFYMLARNKVFIPTDMAGVMFDYYFNGLWALLPTARSGNWRHAHPAAFAIVELLHRHLNSAHPDRFVVYFSSLMLGGFESFDSNVQRLKRRTQPRYPARVRETAALTLALLDDDADAASSFADDPGEDPSPDVCCAAAGIPLAVPCQLS